MIDLTKKHLPNTLEIGGKLYSINTDFRVWIEFSILLECWDKNSDLNLGFIFENEIPIISTKEDIDNIMGFFSNPNILPKNIKGSNERILDYKIDSELIYSAFKQQYGFDLIDIEYLHWHKFKALLSNITDVTKLGQIMGYRCYSGNDKEYLKLKKAWLLPRIATVGEQKKKQIELFNEYFK